VIPINKEDQKVVQSIFHKISNQFELDQASMLEMEFQNCLEQVHSRLKKGITYRNVLKLTPITLFMFLKVKNISFQKKQFLNTLDLEEEEFNRGLKRVVPAYPAYQERDRINIIGSKLKDILTEFNFSNGFLKRCEEIFKYFYPRISHSTDGTITGILAVLSLISLDREETSLSDVCRHSGTTLGSVHNAIKRIIFNQEEKAQFQGLIKSKALVKSKIAEKIGIPLTVNPRKSYIAPQKANTSKNNKQTYPTEIRYPPKNKESYIPPIQSAETTYHLSDKNVQEIIRMHFFELSAEKISDNMDIELEVINSVLEDFSNGNIAFKSSESPELEVKSEIDINSFNLKENPFPQNGPIIKIEKLPVICEKCKNPLLKLVYQNDKTIFFCKYCFK